MSCNCKGECPKKYTLVINGTPQVVSSDQEEIVKLRDAVRSQMPVEVFEIYESCKCKSIRV